LDVHGEKANYGLIDRDLAQLLGILNILSILQFLDPDKLPSFPITHVIDV
jgi:hypothetical protein